jgi:hypothetical protein
MMQPWIRLAVNVMLLSLETQRVILLRMAAMAAGGAHSHAEAQRMVSEKLIAAMSVMGMIALGRSPQSVVRHYRSRVRANERRLSRQKR